MTGTDAGRSRTACSNEDHEAEVPALFRVTFPTGYWNACTACADCLEIIIENQLETPTPMLIEPVAADARSQT